MKHKKWWKFLAAAAGVAGIVSAISISAISCGSPTKQSNETSASVPGAMLPGNASGTMVMTGNNPATEIPTVQFFQNVLGTSGGQQALVQQYAQYAVYEWFKNSKNPVVQSIYQQQVANAQKQYQTNYQNAKKAGGNWQNNFQANTLDPNGGSEQSWIYHTVAQSLMTQFTDLVAPSDFVQNDLSLLAKGSGKGSSTTVSPIVGSNIFLSTINESQYVNGVTSSGNSINSFLFASQQPGIEQGYANFLNYAFDQWIQQTMPLSTPAILFTNGTAPNASGLFNGNFFNNIPDSGSYDFQYFTGKSSNIQQNSSTNLYQEFVNGLNNGSTNKLDFSGNSYVNADEGGAISFPLSLTQGHTTSFITNVSNAYTTYVTPFTAAIMYKFNNLLFGNGTGTGNALDPNVPTAQSFFNAPGVKQPIMNNFVSPSIGAVPAKGSGALALVSTPTPQSTAGVFNFPYVNANNANQPFKGAYAMAGTDSNGQITGIRDTVNIPNSPFIMTRDQFGVHIIGIDRWSSMVQALKNVGSSASIQTKLNAVDTVIRNTILWRTAQGLSDGINTIDLQSILQKYITNNINTLVVGYILTSLNPDTYNMSFVPSGLAEAEATAADCANSNSNIGNSSKSGSSTTTNNLFLSPDWVNNSLDYLSNTFNTTFQNLFINIQKLAAISNDKQYVSEVNQKMYANQSSYDGTENAKNWISYGIAGILPYTRNVNTGNFDSLDAIVFDTLPILNNGQAITASDISRVAKVLDLSPIWTNAVTNGGVGAAPVTELAYMNYTVQEDFNTSLTAFMSGIKAVGSTGPSSTYWSEPAFFTSGAQTVVGQHDTVFVNNLLVNLAVQTAQSTSSVVTNIANNIMLQNQLDPIFDFQTNSFIGSGMVSGTYENVSSLGSLNDWIASWAQNAVDSQYDMSTFTGQSNLYAGGNWNSYAQVEQMAEGLNNASVLGNQFTVENGKNGVVQEQNYDANSSYDTFLSTFAWLLDWNSNDGTFTFGNLQSQLDNMVNNNQIAYIAWSFQNTNQFPVYMQNGGKWSSQPFGLTGNQTNYSNAVTTAIQYDGTFKANPLYLTKLTPYSFNGAGGLTSAYGSGSAYYNWAANDVTDLALQQMSTFTTLSNYWNVAPINEGSTMIPSTGFLGFQSSELNNSSLPSNFYAGSIFGNNFSNQNENFTGALYQYANTSAEIAAGGKNLSPDSHLVSLINAATGSSQLVSYAKMIQNCGFNLTPSASQSLSNVISGFDGSAPLSFTQKVKDLVTVVGDIPACAFAPLDNQFLWNNSGSSSTTLFSSSSNNQSALNTEYVVDEFNSNDVNNLVTTSQFKNSAGDGIQTLNVQSGGFLRENPQAFFDAVALLAMNSSVQSAAQSAISTTEGENQVTVYDHNLAEALGQNVVKNWNDFEEGNNN